MHSEDFSAAWDARDRLVEELTREHCLPKRTLYISRNDGGTLAIGLLHGIFERGYQVPGDISVVGYDDIDFAAHTFPPLTTMRQPAMAIGAAAADALIDHIETGAPLPQLTMLPPTLGERASVAPRRA